MKKILVNGLLAGGLLLLLSFVMLYSSIYLLPSIAEEYYSPAFRSDEGGQWLFFLHPFVLGMALSWFWERFKGQFEGAFWLRGLELGLVYAVVAILPSMWMTFAAINVSGVLVFTWILYAVVQGTIAGLLLAKLSP